MSTPSAMPSVSSRPLTGAAAPSASASAAGTMQTPTRPPPLWCVPSSSQQRAITPLASTAIGAATRPPWAKSVLPVPPPYRCAMRAMPRPAALEASGERGPRGVEHGHLHRLDDLRREVLESRGDEMRRELLARVHGLTPSCACS